MAPKNNDRINLKIKLMLQENNNIFFLFFEIFSSSSFKSFSSNTQGIVLTYENEKRIVPYNLYVKIKKNKLHMYNHIQINLFFYLILYYV